jgi:lipooligosaccharide transport system permease protein
MFLFSGTFFPIEAVLPDWLVAVVQLTPLYHGISLIRGLSTGLIGIGQVWDLLYLLVFFAICLWIAMRQMERKLIK